MKKLTTIVLAVLILCLQVFSCTVAYGADDDGNAIYIKSYTAGRASVNKDESVTIGLVLENTSDNELTDIKIEVDGSSSFSSVYSGERKVLDKIAAKDTEPAVINVVYKGYGNELKIIFKYNDGSGVKTQNGRIIVTEVVPVQEPPTDTSQYVPRLVVDAGQMPVINAGSTYKLKYRIENKSGHQAKNIDLSLNLMDESKTPLVFENYYDMDRYISGINGNDSEEVVFDVCVQRSWQMLTGESPVVVKVGQPLSQ